MITNAGFAGYICGRGSQQHVVSARLTFLTLLWLHVVPASVVPLWEKFAAEHPTTNRFGDVVTLHACTAFNRLGMECIVSGRSIPISPPIDLDDIPVSHFEPDDNE